MSSSDLLRKSLDRALDCARRIAELSVALLNGSDFHQDEIRRLRRDLPHFIRQVSADCHADEPLAADLRHELTCLEEDARELIDWVTHAFEDQRVLYSAIGTDPDAPLRYGLAHHKAFEEVEPKRQAVLESCNRAYLVAMRVCTATDKAAIPLPTVAAQHPVAGSGTPLKDNDQPIIPKCAEVPDRTAASIPRDDQIQQLEPAVRRAYRAFEYAEAKAEKRLADREAYDQLEEDGIPKDSEDWGDLEDYSLPAFDTWARYLRDARRRLGKSKNTQRHARATGKSIVKGDQS